MAVAGCQCHCQCHLDAANAPHAAPSIAAAATAAATGRILNQKHRYNGTLGEHTRHILLATLIGIYGQTLCVTIWISLQRLPRAFKFSLWRWQQVTSFAGLEYISRLE